MVILKLNQKNKRVEVDKFEMENEVVFNFFDKKVPAKDRDDILLKALYIGVLALMEERIASFLAKTQNELGTELESLKMIFDMKSELFYKSALKGAMAEEDIATFLEEYLAERGIKDSVTLTGNEAGALKRNKTGDILCHVNGLDDLRIVIECKFDKSVKLGDIAGRDLFPNRKSDTAWSQLLESNVNREGKVAIIVFDAALVDNSITKHYDSVGYVPNVGFIAIVDSQKGSYTNLAIAYVLARDIALNAKQIDFDEKTLMILIERLIQSIHETQKIKKLVQGNIDSNFEILKTLEKSMLSIGFIEEYLHKFLQDGRLDSADLLEFYSGDKVREKYKSLESDIDVLATR